jgi:hypothetical protein
MHKEQATSVSLQSPVARLLLKSLVLVAVGVLILAATSLLLPTSLINLIILVGIYIGFLLIPQVWGEWSRAQPSLAGIALWVVALLVTVGNHLVLFVACKCVTWIPALPEWLLNHCSQNQYQGRVFAGYFSVLPWVFLLWVALLIGAWQRKRRGKLFGEVLQFTLILSSSREDGARQTVDLVKTLGGRFVKADDRHPVSSLFTANGFRESLVAEVPHETLVSAGRPSEGSSGKVVLVFSKGVPSVVVGQSIALSDRGQLDAVAQGVLRFAQLVYNRLQPKYGWGDRTSTRLFLTPQELAATDVRFIFWVNFFGSDYVTHYGRDFFLNAPGWKIEELESGSILYVTTESFTAWEQQKHPEILAYFRTRIAGIKLYRARG